MISLKIKNNDAHTINCAMDFLQENYGSFVQCDTEGNISVYATEESSGTGWNTHTDEENAEYIKEQLKESFIELV